MEHLHLPSTVTQIRNFAFQNCSSLRSVTFAEGNLRAVGTQVFAGSVIECIVLPLSVAKVKTHTKCSIFFWDTKCNEMLRMITNMYAGDKVSKVDKKDPRQFATIS